MTFDIREVPIWAIPFICYMRRKGFIVIEFKFVGEWGTKQEYSLTVYHPIDRGTYRFPAWKHDMGFWQDVLKFMD